jgi:hypothetical protein
MAVEEHERRRPLLVAALDFALLEPRPEPAVLTTLKGWLNSWSGIGAVGVRTACLPPLCSRRNRTTWEDCEDRPGRYEERSSLANAPVPPPATDERE